MKYWPVIKTTLKDGQSHDIMGKVSRVKVYGCGMQLCEFCIHPLNVAPIPIAFKMSADHHDLNYQKITLFLKQK